MLYVFYRLLLNSAAATAGPRALACTSVGRPGREHICTQRQLLDLSVPASLLQHLTENSKTYDLIEYVHGTKEYSKQNMECSYYY